MFRAIGLTFIFVQPQCTSFMFDHRRPKVTIQQGRNEVYFFIADPVFLAKFLIPDSKSDENSDP